MDDIIELRYKSIPKTNRAHFQTRIFNQYLLDVAAHLRKELSDYSLINEVESYIPFAQDYQDMWRRSIIQLDEKSTWLSVPRLRNALNKMKENQMKAGWGM